MKTISRKPSIHTITLVGAGNVGHHLGRKLLEQGLTITQVFSRKKRKAAKLATILNAESTNDLNNIFPGSDLYLLAVHDDALTEVADRLTSSIASSDPLVAHTSGATPSTILKDRFRRFGVFYPLMSFSIDRPLVFETVPLCIDARYARDRKALMELGRLLSRQVQRVNDHQRATLHVAAVFVNNFTNLMYHMGQDIAEADEMSFDLLKPILLETARKAQQHSPEQMQTGPAIRKDYDTLTRHLDFLQNKHPGLYPIYLQLTRQLFPGFKPLK